MSLKEKMRYFYNHSLAYRDILRDNQRYCREFELEHYVKLLKKYAPEEGVILDLGCGIGESTRKLSECGYYVVGVDISTLFLSSIKEHNNDSTKFVVADITKIPFRNHSVPCIAMLNVVEHILNIEEFLEGLLRILSHYGRIIIVSPNLLSPVKPLRHIFGVEGFNTNFYGSNAQAFMAIFNNVWLILRKLVTPHPTFIYRNPILDDFQCPDDDAVYMSNYIDLKKWFLSKGLFVKYQQLIPGNRCIISRIKSYVLKRLPWLDKGFCMIVERRLNNE